MAPEVAAVMAAAAVAAVGMAAVRVQMAT